MSLVLSIVATLFFSIGMFLTKGVTLKISIYKGIGPLFILNALFITPLIPYGPRWILWQNSIPYLHISGAIGSALAAGVIFMVISRSTASVATLGSALAPAVVLLAGPISLETKIVPTQILTIIFLFFATLLPLRNSISGISSLITIFLMIFTSAVSGLITISVALLFEQGVGATETFIVRQILAGVIFMTIFPPTGLDWLDFIQLVRRSFFVSLGWILSIYAIQQGSPVIVQSVMATTPIWVILIEVFAYKKRPSRSLIFSAVTIAIGICVLVRTS